LLTKLNPAVAVIPPLGHHAGHDEAKGFCQFNIVSTFLLNEKDVKKILILDWNVHHGNDTQKTIF
jgi:acetoin utilization deacetylase AcuC-like enzyme